MDLEQISKTRKAFENFNHKYLGNQNIMGLVDTILRTFTT